MMDYGSSLTFGSLFAGIGGFDLGLERAGMVCKWQVEIDGRCNEVLGHHWPDVQRHGDVNDVGKRNLEPVDLVCGGFPCQDLSVAGKREGLSGERSGLWFEFHRVLEELRPRWAIIENVPGLLSSNGGRDFAVVLRGLAELGYGVTWRVLDAQYFGVAQRRRRVFLVGSLGDGRAAEVLFESEGSAWDSPPSRETWQRIADGTLSRAFSRVAGGDDPGANKGAALVVQPHISHTLTAPDPNAPKRDGRRQDGCRQDRLPIVAFGESGQGYWQQGIRPLRAEGENRPSRPSHLVAYGLDSHATTTSDKDAESHKTGGPRGMGITEELSPSLREGRQMAVAHTLRGGKTGWCGSEDGTGRGVLLTMAFAERSRGDGRNFEAQEELAYALANPASGGTQHSRRIAGTFGVRRLTPTECERLQGFPDGWTLVNGMSDSARYRMLGNAVAVPCAEWIGRRIVEVENQDR